MTEHTELCRIAAEALDLDVDEVDPDGECWNDLPDPEPDTDPDPILGDA